ncbi:hypothetical protein J2847_006457 [Azospirillum agricola]|uniref:hypothetical protein n=1 Tax=Azospirillum agricola TaxID=1720247 RepID=UPI001AE2BF88|nr:hypothetical protein [Azospirillum agricola]MBP2233122.1 hypothetical protein [Azospirillum agricola]
MNDTVHGVGPRTRAYLRARFDAPRAKAVANELGISVPLANKLLGGYAPRMWLFEEMVARWDGEFLRSVFAEAYAAEDARLGELEAEVQALRAALATARQAVGGFVDGDGLSNLPSGAAELDDLPSNRIAELVGQLVETLPAKVRAAQRVDDGELVS